MPFEEQQFELLWAEGGAYIMGVEQALKQWKPFIKANGYLVIGDLVWLSDNQSQEAVAVLATELSRYDHQQATN